MGLVPGGKCSARIGPRAGEGRGGQKRHLFMELCKP